MKEVKVTLGNSFSKIEGLTTEQHRKLKKVLSYTDNPEAAYFGRGFVRVKSLLDKKGFFPTGLLGRVQKTHPNARLIDSRKRPMPVSEQIDRITNETASSMPTPHIWQQRAANLALLNSRGGIVAPTGTGKSLVIALIASRLKVKTLVIVPTLEIKKQLKEALNAFNVSNVTVENIDSKAVQSEKDYDCLIIDECHHVAAKTYQTLNKKYWTKIYYRFFLTATWGRNKTNEHLLFEGIAGEVIYQLTYKQAIKKGYIVPIEAYYVDLPKKETEAYTWAQVYKDLVVDHDVRNAIIAGMTQDLEDAGMSTLCLVKEIKHGENLKDLNPSLRFVHGQDESSRIYVPEFNRKEINTLVATTGIMGEGVDTKPCEYVIICGLGKAKSAFMQQIGRAVRTYPGKESAKVILFRDTSHKFTLRHFKEQCKILKNEYGVTPTKLEI